MTRTFKVGDRVRLQPARRIKCVSKTSAVRLAFRWPEQLPAHTILTTWRGDEWVSEVRLDCLAGDIEKALEQAYTDGFEECRERAAEAGSKAAWMHFHYGDDSNKEQPTHTCNRSDWSYADAVSIAIRALMPQAGEEK